MNIVEGFDSLTENFKYYNQFNRLDISDNLKKYSISKLGKLAIFPFLHTNEKIPTEVS